MVEIIAKKHLKYMADKRKKHMECTKNNNISNGPDENYGLAQPL